MVTNLQGQWITSSGCLTIVTERTAGPSCGGSPAPISKSYN